MTIKVAIRPYKRAELNVRLHFIQMFMNTSEVAMQVKQDMQRYITNNMYQLILQMHVLVSSLHILWHDLLFVFQLNKNSTIRL